MKKEESFKKSEQAFQLYASGLSQESISREIGISRNSVISWIKKYNWDERKQEILKKTAQKIDNSLAPSLAQQFKITAALMNKAINDLRTGNCKQSSIMDVTKLMDHQLQLIKIEAGISESKKKEEPSYVFEIINPEPMPPEYIPFFEPLKANDRTLIGAKRVKLGDKLVVTPVYEEKV
jgi:transposase